MGADGERCAGGGESLPSSHLRNLTLSVQCELNVWFEE